MTQANPNKRIASVKRINKLLDRFFVVGITNVKELLNQLYSEVKSLRRLSKRLKDIGVTIKVNDLLILLEYFGIPRVSRGKHLNNKKKGIESLPVDHRTKLYLWGFCFGDARLVAYLSTIRIDLCATLPTSLCLSKCLRDYLPSNKMSIRKIGNYFYFSAIVDKNNFSFLLNTIDEVANQVNDFDDLVALLAGLIDAEGSIYIKIRSRHYKFRGQTKQSITLDQHIEITNCDQKLLRKLQQLLTDYGIKATIPQSKTGFGCSRLRIYRREHISKMIPMLLKYMKHSEKVHKLKVLLTIIQNTRNKNQKEKRKLLIEFKKQLKNL